MPLCVLPVRTAPREALLPSPVRQAPIKMKLGGPAARCVTLPAYLYRPARDLSCYAYIELPTRIVLFAELHTAGRLSTW
jgi:hypothetical protein